MHPVNIGISGNYHLVVAQSLDTLLYVEGCLKKIELIVLIHDLLRHAVGIEWLTTEREYRLGLGVSHFRDGAGCGVALGDEN